jgi:hypothetical protein
MDVPQVEQILARGGITHLLASIQVMRTEHTLPVDVG